MRHMLRAVAASAALVLPAAAPAQTLDVAVNQAPVGLDPHIATAFGTFQLISGTIYEGLTALDAGTGRTRWTSGDPAGAPRMPGPGPFAAAVCGSGPSTANSSTLASGRTTVERV